MGRLSALVNDLLDFSRLEAGRLEVLWAPVAIAESLSQLVEDAMPTAQARGLSLRLSLDSSLHEGILDRRMFEKIVLNLLSNALKFTEPGGEVQVELRAQGEGFQLSVSDTGIGIPP